MNSKLPYAALLLLAVTSAQAGGPKPMPTAGKYVFNVSPPANPCLTIGNINPVTRTFDLIDNGAPIACNMEKLTPLVTPLPDPATLPETGNFYCDGVGYGFHGSYSSKSISLTSAFGNSVNYVFKPVAKGVLDTKGVCI